MSIVAFVAFLRPSINMDVPIHPLDTYIYYVSSGISYKFMNETSAQYIMTLQELNT